MTFRKSNTYLSLVNSYLIDSPQPSSINYWWNLGSLLGLCLVIQIASGIFLAMHYSSNIELAFNSVEHIMRDVNSGWLIRYIHANGASFFFICLYLHIGKALYYGSYKTPRFLVWCIGVIIFILTIATAFMGYYNNSPKSITYLSKNVHNVDKTLYNKSINYKFSHIYLNSYLQKRQYHTSPHKDITSPTVIFDEMGIKPYDYWDNLEDKNVRSNLHKTVKGKCGIYIIINKITRNCYVGSASTNRIHARFSNHLLNLRGSKLVKRSLQKYGLNNFIFAILEYYPYEINRINNKELLTLETNYISLIMPKYNILTEAGNSFGYKHNEETLLLIKSLFTEERRNLLRTLQMKRKNNWSDESKLKLRNIALNRPKDYLTTQGLNKIISTNSLIVKLFNDSSNNNYICQFKSINNAAHYLCCSYKTIQRALNLGWIYVPKVFIPFLNNNYINHNNDIISSIPNNKDFKYKSGLVNKEYRVKLYLTK